MADTYMLKINRRDGTLEVAGDKEWVEEKLAEFADIYNGPLLDAPRRDRERRHRPPDERQQAKAPQASTKRVSRRRSGPTRVKGIDLSPKDKQSFEAFVAEKQPASQDDRNVSSAYYLAEIAGISPITMDHVFTCYRDRDWAIPNDLRNSLQVTASRKGFLDTADMDDLKLEPRGINHVERALPTKKTD